jgi:Carboxypeptidase regulatory-like domain
MTRFAFSLALLFIVTTSLACHPGPVFNTGPQNRVGGTIAGIVRLFNSPVTGRTVTVTNVTTGAAYTTVTGADGGYTVKVPAGTYRIDVELRPGETCINRPEPTKIKNSDLDASRDFDIAVTAGG